MLTASWQCANVLVDETYTCLISDFGQSEIRAEAYRMSGISRCRKPFLSFLGHGLTRLS